MKMDYYVFGNGPVPMIILPGLSITPVTPSGAQVAEAYSIFEKDFTVYLIDRRTDISKGYSVYDMADDTAALMRELNIENACIYGVSQGGMIAQIIAARYPELTRKLCICSSTSYTGDSIGTLLDIKLMAENKDRRGLNASFAELIYSEEFYDQFKSVIADMSEAITDEDMERFEIYSSASDGFDIRNELASVDKPVFIIGSRKDKVIRPSAILETAEYLKTDTSVFLYSGYSHAVYDEALDIKERIYSFFRG